MNLQLSSDKTKNDISMDITNEILHEIRNKVFPIMAFGSDLLNKKFDNETDRKLHYIVSTMRELNCYIDYLNKPEEFYKPKLETYSVKNIINSVPTSPKV